MLYKLSRNTFLREYGPYTYIQNIRSGADVMFKDATRFFRWLTRTPIGKDEILRKLSSEYDISAAEGNVEYMPIYFTMFFSHNPVPETMIYELPSFEQLAGKIHHA